MLLYDAWMKSGKMPFRGLCSSLPYEPHDFGVWMFKPTYASCWSYWAGRTDPYIFNPLRQNIILFLAAMNGEL